MTIRGAEMWSCRGKRESTMEFVRTSPPNCVQCVADCRLQLWWLMPRPPCLLSWTEAPNCTTLKANTPLSPRPSMTLFSAQLSLHQNNLTPPLPFLTLTGSAQPNSTLLCLCLTKPAQNQGLWPWRKGWGGLNLEGSRYTSPNCLFIKLTVSMKKSFLLPCFPSPPSSRLLLPRLVCLPNTFTFKDRAVVWCFTVERSRAQMTLCSPSRARVCVWVRVCLFVRESALHLRELQSLRR